MWCGPGAGTYEDAGGPQGERLEHVGAAADAAVQVHRDAALRGLHDLLERADGGRHVVQLPRAVVGHDDARRAGVDGQPRCRFTDDMSTSSPTQRDRRIRRQRAEIEKRQKKLTVLRRDDSLHQDRHRGDALQPLDILHIHQHSSQDHAGRDATTATKTSIPSS